MYVGIDLGGTNIAIGLVDENCNVVRKDSVPTGRKRPMEEIVKDMASLTKRLLKEEGIDPSEIKEIGIGSPGAPNKEKNGILFASSFPLFRNAEIGKELNKYFKNANICLENDANSAAYGEFIAGAAKGLSDVVVVTLGTGVGGGIIIDKKIYSGFNNAAGEIGHKTIKFDGVKCECGRVGCWEAYASVTALIRQTKEAMLSHPESIINEITGGDPEKISGKTVFEAADKGDKTAEEVIENYIKYISVGVVDVVNVFQPEAVVVGGGISKQGDRLLDPVRKAVKEASYGDEIPKAKIVAATLGNDAGIIGAAMLWKQR